MSRGISARLRKLETKARIGDEVHNLSGKALWARSRAVADTLVQAHGGLEQALEFLREDGGEQVAEFAALALAARSVDELMGYDPRSQT